MMNDDQGLRTRIQEDMKESMRTGDTKRRDATRLLTAAIKQREVDERITLNDAQVIEVINKMIKQRKDSAAQFQAAFRQDLADQEIYEIDLLQKYLPAQLSDAEITQIIQVAIKETGAMTAKDMGKVMGILKAKLHGRADMGAVSAKIKTLLGS